MNSKMIKQILLITLSLNLLACGTQSQAPSAVAVEKSNAYIRADLYNEFKSQIPDFPIKGSPEQTADETELRKLQKSRSVKDCARATSEVVVNLQNFYGKPYGELNEQQTQLLAPFIEEIRHESGPYIGQIKKGYTRLRPYEYIKDLNPCVHKETSFAYPSGHATLAVLYSLVLADLFPSQKSILAKRADQIALDRVLGGVHHPTDIAAGKKLGLLLYTEIKKSQAYNDDIVKFKKMLN